MDKNRKIMPAALMGGGFYPYKGELLGLYEYRSKRTMDNLKYLIKELSNFIIKYNNNSNISNKTFQEALILMKQSYNVLLDLKEIKIRIDESLVKSFKNKLKDFESILIEEEKEGF